MSGLGKGITISSIGRVLQGCGLRVTSIKIDPYLNVDAGTMSPFEHGEVFVLNDGGETDLDLGNYERFLNVTLTSDHNITTGKIYRKTIAQERRGDFLGKTVQVVPHITDEIQNWIKRVASIPVDGSGLEPDICLIEVGGTVGDIESMVFLEALRQFQFRVGVENFCLCFVSLCPIVGGEQKTKPTQNGVKELRSVGLSPSVIFCRSSEALDAKCRTKISNFCHVGEDCVMSLPDVNNIYHVPGMLVHQKLHSILRKELNLKIDEPDLREWQEVADSIDNFTKTVQICIVGKYNGLQDSYLSILKALKHSATSCSRELNLVWVDATHLEDTEGSEHTAQQKDDAWKSLREADGVLVPGGFGNRGFLGKVLAAKYCRTNQKPYLGVCLGFQAMVVEIARNVLNFSNANSTEFDEGCVPHDVVIFMPEIDKENMGGTMRLGERNTIFVEGEASMLKILYGGVNSVGERHRHRYEVNPEKIEEIQSTGLKFVGKDETGTRMEIAELPQSQHPYYVGCQYHPEFKTQLLKPSPPFLGLIMASCGMLESYLEKESAAQNM